jgi:predicted alpha/beta superfamily hydrolase
VNYAVYLPADYQASSRRYPVVYLLHGYSDN